MRNKDTAVRISLLKSGFGNNRTRRAAAILRLCHERATTAAVVVAEKYKSCYYCNQTRPPHCAPANSTVLDLYTEGSNTAIGR
jgi:hypothetical protein